MTSVARVRKPGARDRLIEAAERLFYAEGIRAVGVDRLCAEAGVSKRSLYQHFAGKDDVVTAMIQAQAASFAARLRADGLGPRARIMNVFDAQAAGSASLDTYGCPFIAAATELKDRDHPAVRIASEQKAALTQYFADALREAGAREADLLAVELRLLFDGAAAYSVVQGGATPATTHAVETLLDAHGVR